MGSGYGVTQQPSSAALRGNRTPALLGVFRQSANLKSLSRNGPRSQPLRAADHHGLARDRQVAHSRLQSRLRRSQRKKAAIDFASSTSPASIFARASSSVSG